MGYEASSLVLVRRLRPDEREQQIPSIRQARKEQPEITQMKQNESKLSTYSSYLSAGRPRDYSDRHRCTSPSFVVLSFIGEIHTLCVPVEQYTIARPKNTKYA